MRVKNWSVLIVVVTAIINVMSVKMCWDALHDLREALVECKQSALVRP